MSIISSRPKDRRIEGPELIFHWAAANRVVSAKQLPKIRQVPHHHDGQPEKPDVHASHPFVHVANPLLAAPQAHSKSRNFTDRCLIVTRQLYTVWLGVLFLFIVLPHGIHGPCIPCHARIPV